MRLCRLVAAALLSTATACAPGLGATRLEREGNASLTGILTLPPNRALKENTSCAGVTVRVAHASQPQTALGDVLVKQGRERCLYVVNHLPSDAELRLEVRPGPAWRCEDGQAPTLTPRPATLRLRDYETATRDFRTTCGG